MPAPRTCTYIHIPLPPVTGVHCLGRQSALPESTHLRRKGEREREGEREGEGGGGGMRREGGVEVE